ncbi:MAG: aromatic ring-hydroxylating dioxygenase subunit alpha [Alphaproteobacteria bacterium]|nr:aromatic ring-hydroxylating dioxygenase subunit alpha [Alphaproteobacteria bacterium]
MTKRNGAQGESGRFAELSADLSATRESLLKARHLPGWFYTSPEVFEREIDTIFMKEWLCVGRVEEFEKPGDYNALRIAGEPLLIARDNQGKLGAFRNVCLHRGVEVASGQGNAKSFKCPYHAWVYELDGKLAGAPYSKEVEGFDFSNCSLARVKLDTWGGYIFVNFDPGAIGLGEYLDLDGIRDYAAYLKPEETRTSDKFSYVLPCNWKFVPENVMDMYHVGVIHNDSFGGHFPINDFRYVLDQYGYHANYESFTMAPKGATLFGPMPWLEGKVTDRFACTIWIRPSMNIFARHDLIQPIVTTPIDVDHTLVTVYTQLPKTFFNEPAFDEKNKIYADFIRMVLSEDNAMLESLQNGVRSRAFKPGPTVKLERAIHHALNYYLDHLYGSDESSREERVRESKAMLREAAATRPAQDGGYSQSFLRGAAE